MNVKFVHTAKGTDKIITSLESAKSSSHVSQILLLPDIKTLFLYMKIHFHPFSLLHSFNPFT